MSIKSLANEPQVGIDDGGSKRLCTIKTVALDGMANGIGMNI
jgi:hypothetical protein